jgi:uncharacterized protein YdhG (YjbR/CyaY superfamily)
MKKFATIDEYLASLPEKESSALGKLRRTIRTLAPSATEGIAYGMPVFRYHGYLLGFAAFKQHLSLFTMNGTYIAEHARELEKYPATKGAIHFTAEQPLPPSLLRRIIQDRMEENAGRAAGRKK